MHEPVIRHLEEYLGGAAPVAEVEEHLNSCPGCRKELEGLRIQSALFQSLRAPREIEVPPAFYTRVMQKVEAQATPSIWSLFGESLFAKRLAYVSASAMVLLGAMLVSSTQPEEPLAELYSESVLAGDLEPVSMDNSEHGRDVVFANLATYQQDADE